MRDWSCALPDIEKARLSPERLAAVRATGMLDAPPAAALDRLTKLASVLLDVPATFISLVDEQRDFYLSHSGFGEPLATARELGGTTFCHYAMVNDGPLLIDDTRADATYRNVPTVQSLGVGAYMGIPMTTAKGEFIGSFCAIDFKPRAWSERDRAVMEQLAQSAMREMALLEAIGEHLRKADEANLALVEAERLTRSRIDILNSVSHDLRDPLGSILLALGPIEAYASDERAIKAVAIVRRQAARMRRLLDDLLDVARIDGGNLTIGREAVNVPALLGEIAEDFAVQAEAAGVSISVDAPAGYPAVAGDGGRLLQALSNLVSNALKFTPRGGRIRLAAAREADTLRVQVVDSGCGIDPSQLSKIFDPFWQADARDARGAGLGLHIVRGIVRAHGGKIGVRSALGAGTTFEIELPISP